MDLGRFLWEVGEKASDWLERYLTATGGILWGKGGSPPTPDYAGAAQTQGAANIQAAIAQRILSQTGQNTPFGSISYSPTGSQLIPRSGGRPIFGNEKPEKGGARTIIGYEGGVPEYNVPTYESTITLSPEQQRLYEGQTGQQQALSDIAGGLTQRIGQSVEQPFQIGDLGTRSEDAAYERATRRLDPQWAAGETAERTRLANQGFDLRSEGGRNALDDFSRRRTDAYGAARNAAVQEGRAERQQKIAEMLMERQQPLSEFNALRTGTAPQMPSFAQNQAQQIGAPDFIGAEGATYQANADRANMQQQQQASLMNGLFRLGLGAMTGGIGAAVPINVAGGGYGGGFFP